MDNHIIRCGPCSLLTTMITFMLVVYLTTGPYTIAETTSERTCKSWESFSAFNVCVEVQTL